MNDNDRPEKADRSDASATQTRDREQTTRGSAEADRDAMSRDVPRDVRDREDVRDDGEEGFLPPERMEDLRQRWNDIQAGFVDDPRTAVEKAQGLVAKTVNELTDIFSNERASLESQWNRGQQADTEVLRVALTRYRVFFNRLLRTDVNDRR